jgi:cell division protein ZapA
MNAAPEAVTIRILEKEYQVACPREERQALLESARYLDQKMREIKDTRKLIGIDRIAVMAALNITNDLLRSQETGTSGSETVKSSLRHLQQKVETALLNARQMEM